MAARVLVVDDHPLVCAGLTQVLDAAPDLEVCGAVHDIDSALAAIERDHPALVTVDIALGGDSGFALLRAVRARPSPPPMLVISMHDEELYAERALREGASGYVMKSEPAARIIEAVRTVLGGSVAVSAEISARMLRRLSTNPSRASTSETAGLTARELEVLEAFGRGLGTAEVASALGVSVKTIETHRARVRAKLGIRTHAQLLRFAYELGRTERRGAGETGPQPAAPK